MKPRGQSQPLDPGQHHTRQPTRASTTTWRTRSPWNGLGTLPGTPTTTRIQSGSTMAGLKPVAAGCRTTSSTLSPCRTRPRRTRPGHPSLPRPIVRKGQTQEGGSHGCCAQAAHHSERGEPKPGTLANETLVNGAPHLTNNIVTAAAGTGPQGGGWERVLPCQPRPPPTTTMFCTCTASGCTH